MESVYLIHHQRFERREHQAERGARHHCWKLEAETLATPGRTHDQQRLTVQRRQDRLELTRLESVDPEKMQGGAQCSRLRRSLM